MRRTAPSRCRGRRQTVAKLSLFPFLAVLICTMGALILLLVVIARQARLQAAETARTDAATAAEEAVEKQADLEADREMIQWRVEQLKTSLQQTESQLADTRLGLGHIEDHARRLREQIAQLQAIFGELDQLGDHGSRLRGQLQGELSEIEVQLAESGRRLAETQRAAARRRGSYAVVPYQGPHETRRRPIYIECRERSIVLQPEGVVLNEEDFDGPMGPGNPLAAALRATREYLLAHGGFDPEQSGEPYPLLLVRPDGIMAYYAARDAMESWASEFGYELIGEDWKVEFQPPDAQLAEVVRKAIDTARVRQKQLAAAAPSHYGRRGRAKYRATPTRGGVVRDGGSVGEDPAYRKPGFGGAQRQDKVFGGPPRERPESSAEEGGAVARPGQWQPEEESAQQRPAAGRSGEQVESLAATRGQDWALRDAARGSVGLTRPIRVACLIDRLVIMPEQGVYRGKTIPLGPRTEEALDGFVSAVWEHMDSWGIAGKGMYWRPELHVRVAPNAEQRYAELDALLDGSGLTVRRKDE